MRVRGRLLAPLLGISLAIGISGTVFAANEGHFHTGTNQTGSTLTMDYGDSISNLATVGFNNNISSMTSANVTGHGFVLWTGTSGTGSSFKVCGPTTRDTMPTGFDNTVSSIYSTSSCPS